MLSETEITLRSAAFIQDRGWKIEALALPGSGSSIVIQSSSSIGRDLTSSVIPDIVASHQRLAERILIVESKAVYCHSDAEKLHSLLLPEYEDSVMRQLGCLPKDLCRCIAFGVVPSTRNQDFENAQEGRFLTSAGLVIEENDEPYLLWDHNGDLNP